MMVKIKILPALINRISPLLPYLTCAEWVVFGLIVLSCFDLFKGIN
jgi:hypothetical protein